MVVNLIIAVHALFDMCNVMLGASDKENQKLISEEGEKEREEKITIRKSRHRDNGHLKRLEKTGGLKSAQV